MLRNFLIGTTALALSACASLQQQSQTDPQLGGTPSLHLAQAALESGDFELATNVFENASANSPGDADIQLKYADALLKQGQVDKARTVLVSHMSTVSNPKPLHGGLALIYIVEGQASQAIAELDAMGDTGENRWSVDRAIALDMLGRHTEAQGLYRKALAVDPNNTAVTSDLVLSLLLSGNKSEATQMASSLASDPSPRVRATYGVVEAANGNLPAARDALPGIDEGQLMEVATAINAKR